MLARLLEFALAQRLLMAVAAALIAVAGVQSWRSLPIDAFPDVSPTQVKIILKAPGMTPEEVEARITIPIEQEMLGIPQERQLRSVSKYAIADRKCHNGFCSITPVHPHSMHVQQPRICEHS